LIRKTVIIAAADQVLDRVARVQDKNLWHKMGGVRFHRRFIQESIRLGCFIMLLNIF